LGNNQGVVDRINVKCYEEKLNELYKVYK